MEREHKPEGTRWKRKFDEVKTRSSTSWLLELPDAERRPVEGVDVALRDLRVQNTAVGCKKKESSRNRSNESFPCDVFSRNIDYQPNTIFSRDNANRVNRPVFGTY